MATPHDPFEHDEPTEFTGTASALPAAADAPASAMPGSRIGPYLLIEAIGEGGMGEVFLAEQAEPIRRRVALKLVRRQIVDALSLAYFEIERQALARMEHPAIARVYDAGRTPEGFPYFAMEYVDGVTLGRWHEQSAPDLGRRLRVFITLVRGVQHAHERGIVHRDLKPDNVLVTEVDGEPQPKLIDFGIAVGIDAGTGAGTVNRAGSIDYMSPEQFVADHAALDARSDVYSLGLILLHLLVPHLRTRGEPTQRPTELHARLCASLVGRRDPELDAVPGELRHLLARALAPDRENRYESASALADDVQRFVDKRPLRALPRSRTYALRKLVARNRVAFTLAAGVVLAVLVGLGATLWSLAEAEREAARARATADFLATVLSSVNPDVARDLDKTLLRKVLDEAATRADHELAGQPDVRAVIERAITESYLGLGDHARALEHASRAHANMLALHGTRHDETWRSLLPYSEALVRSGKLDEAEALLRQAIADATRNLGADHELTLRLRHHLGLALRDLGRVSETLVEFADAANGLQTALGEDAVATVNAAYAWAIALADSDRFDEAIPRLKALIARRGERRGIDHPEVLSMRNSLAVFFMMSRRYADGERELKALLAPFSSQYGADNPTTLMIHGNLGGALRQQGKVEEAGPYYLRAMEGYRKLFGTDNPRSIMTLHNYGNWLLDAGRVDEAAATQADALAAADRIYKELHPTQAEIMTSIGKVRTRQERFAEAEQVLLKSVEMKVALRGETNSRLFQSREALRELYAAWKRPEEIAKWAEPPAP